MRSRVCLCLCLSLFALVAPFTDAIKFSLRQGEETCLSDDVMSGQVVVGDYSVEPQGQRISVTVTDSNGLQIYNKPAVSEGKFANTATRNGDYRACFMNSEGPGPKTVNFVLRSGLGASKDYTAMAKKDNLKPVELELKRMEDVVTLIHDEMLYLKGREEAAKMTNDSTASRVSGFSFLSIAILFGLGASQIFYLKRFFKSKKLIQ